MTKRGTHHPAPATLRPIHNPTPSSAHAYGEDSERNKPGLNFSPCPERHHQFPQMLKGDWVVGRGTGRTGEEEVEGDEDDNGGRGDEVAGDVVGHGDRRGDGRPGEECDEKGEESALARLTINTFELY